MISALRVRCLNTLADSSASQVFNFAFNPLFVIVSGTDGSTSIVVSAFSGVGAGLVDIIENAVHVKGDFNVLGHGYTVVAFA